MIYIYISYTYCEVDNTLGNAVHMSSNLNTFFVHSSLFFSNCIRHQCF